MTVRPAVPGDLDAIADLEIEAFPDDAWTRDYLEIALAGRMPTVRLLVAVDDAVGTVVGHALISIVYEIAELQRIAVTATYRRQGYATALLDETVALGTREGAERLLLEVREGNDAALAFYRVAGFAEIDRRERYYRDGTTGIVLCLDLQPPEAAP